jgi:hypothetical protein
MPIFSKSLQRIDSESPKDAIKAISEHIRYMQEQLEFTLLSLDSSNIAEIDTDKTVISDSSGSTSIGSYIHLVGKNGESFSAGRNSKGKFEFSVKGKDGVQVLYLDSSGKLIITENTNLTIDGGKW